MDALKDGVRVGIQPVSIFLRACVVLLTLATAGIHASLGGPLFTLNALAYLGLAVAMVFPGPFARYRWLVRLALLGFTAATIAGWLAFGARFPLAYVDKGIEVTLIAFLAIELWLFDGGPRGIVRDLRELGTTVVARLPGRAAR
jgi:hypothetical protein